MHTMLLRKPERGSRLLMEVRTKVCAFLLAIIFSRAAGFDPLDPTGTISIKWDVMSWTPDGYVAVVTMTNFQMYRHIMSPGWTIGWTWSKKEVIWSIVGAQATYQGDCSRFKGNIPHSCKKTPAIVDLLPGTPYNQQVANCCKGGVVASWGQDPADAVSAFQLSVGNSGTTNNTVKLPKNFTLLGPGRGYTCGSARIVRSTRFITADRRRTTQAFMTWNVTCTYSQFIASRKPTCCVSFSSSYNSTIAPCPTCACDCQNKNCVKDSSLLSTTKKGAPMLQCTNHMCPVRVHWHVKPNYQQYWRAKITITNLNYTINYTQWNLVVQNPNLNKVTRVFSFNYKRIVPYKSINDTVMFFGIKNYNDVLMEAGPDGNVQSELLVKKNQDNFTLKHGWAFPRRVYFNGDQCVLPSLDMYPDLPK